MVVVNRALHDIIDRLQSQFPEVALLAIYEQVADVRALATRHLPNVAAFRDVVEQQAREHLCAVAGGASPVGCP
jgi:hypothetical protein